ncbi:hypothetical protein PH547_11040 [Rhizobium sp. CNPSo 3464]|uniref:DUF6538 domain-containing protein n=1 Tax=Rhizobium sp. CNPSo 3464 TaxID=3021406 RepID=UPI0025508531|nr:DUF6538 domain-containing protein [Rhizobium sp. CNPSo 3464]MDK4739408.1 hypothetical protein [Rhizobium sp. CNPSo 3464]
MSNFLRREADSFIFRRRVPAIFQARLGQAEIYRSLKTTVRKVARTRAAHLFIGTERLFRMLEEDDDYIVNDEDIRAAVRLWLDTDPWKRRLDQIVDTATPGWLRMYHDTMPDTLIRMSAMDGFTARQALAIEAEAALENADFGRPGGETLRRAEATLQRQIREYIDRRMQAVFAPESVAGAPAAQTAQPSAPAAPLSMSKLSSHLKAWQKDIAAGYNHNKPLKDPDHYLKSVELFIGLLGDVPVGKISFETAAEFRELALQLPATHGKGSVGSPKKELARARADKSLPTVTMKTVKRHFSGLNSLWKWLVFKKYVPASLQPFSGHAFPGTKSKKSARDDWSREDMQRFFTSREYRDALDSSALHWLPLISLHSGMRLEEICRLRPGIDIVVKDGMQCFDIAVREDWDPKSEAGERLVPVHSWLLKHGFMDFVIAQRERGAQHLFSPELRLRGRKLSADFSRDFSKLKIGLGVGKKTVFHSFRHTFRTVLESTDFKESHIDAVMGHEGGGGEGRTYVKGVTTAKLKEVVEAFEPPLDLGFLRAAVAVAPPPSPKVGVKKRKLTPPVLDERGRIVRRRKV